ncbi:3-oxoacyl-[acyl-carrier-protein] reductase FabG [bioreactor metagenome]|uniref:3-oxoacyl-[acyl-carrier-protein] reductase FabG n=1 Tax=bioreactor metagenome TaxID=1076179 RepID=A0A645GAE0_9ZZZZ
MNEEGIKDTVSEIKAKNEEAFGVFLDVTDSVSPKEMALRVIKEYRHIDILVNNAGISQKLSVDDMEVEDMIRIFSVNVFGLFRCVKAVLPYMRAQKYGRIINVSSLAGKSGLSYFGGVHYAASKAAVLGFSKALVKEVVKDGITVNCVCPGLIDTDIWKSLSKDAADMVVKSLLMGRPGKTDEISATIAFLVSEEASYITGEDIDVNGGAYMD